MTTRAMSIFAVVSLVLGVAACNDEDKGQGDATDATVADTTTATDATVTEDTATAATDTATTATDTATTATDTATTATDTATTATDTATTATDTATVDDATTATDAADDTASGPACESTADCVHCGFDKVPTSTADCACPSPCQDYVTTADTCAAAQAGWDSFCAGDKWADQNPCPVARCVAQDPLYCHEGECTDACTAVQCETPTCPLEEQVKVPGECCPRCVGESACTNAGDCTSCAYPTEVTQPSECYCVFCASTPMLATTCETNTKSWQKYCDPWPQDFVCPQPSCLPPMPLACTLPNGTCETDPYACAGDEDCTTCTGFAPSNPSECACPMCPHPASKQECDDVQTYTDLYCADFDFSKCLPPPCPFPGNVGCDRFGGGYCGVVLDQVPR